MDPDHVPGWLVALVAFFGISTAVCFGAFLQFHADAAMALEEANATRTRNQNVLRPREAQLKARLVGQPPNIIALDNLILERRNLLADIERRNDEEQVAVEQSLLPQHKQALAAIEERLSNRERRFKQLLADVVRARGELATQTALSIDNQRRHETSLRDVRSKIEVASQELEQQKRDNRSVVLGLEKTAAEREARVKELLDRRELSNREMRSDGQILQSRANDGFVIINRGLDQNIRVGMQFVVYNRRGGVNVAKGKVEVTNVEARMSTARVMAENDANDPIIPGDHLHNEIYNPDETMVYVLAGDFSLYTKPELTRFIEDADGQVDRVLSERTHYLVAGDNAEAAIQSAIENGILIISERELLSHVRMQDRFKLRRGMTFAIAGDFDAVDAGVVREFISNNGGVLVGEVTDGVNVLIAGDNAAEQISKASLIGATIINQRQLIHMMGRAPAAESTAPDAGEAK